MKITFQRDNNKFFYQVNFEDFLNRNDLNQGDLEIK